MNKQTISNDFYNMTKEEKLKYRTQCAKNALKEYRYRQTLKQESAYCDRNICLKNEYNGIGCDECEVTKSQEPCEDAISRQAVLDIDFNRIIHTTAKPAEMIRQKVEQLSPVTPQQKMGYWITEHPLDIFQPDEYRCSECSKYHYKRVEECPNCRAKMQEVEE